MVADMARDHRALVPCTGDVIGDVTGDVPRNEAERKAKSVSLIASLLLLGAGTRLDQVQPSVCVCMCVYVLHVCY